MSAIVEAFGWIYFGVGYVAGWVNLDFALTFLFVNVGFGVLLTVSALLLDEISHHTFPRQRQIFVLLVAAIVENFGYRQLNLYWRVLGLVQWLIGTKASWGDMKRTAGWANQLPSQATNSNRA
jgi:hypothetical protein